MLLLLPSLGQSQSIFLHHKLIQSILYYLFHHFCCPVSCYNSCRSPSVVNRTYINVCISSCCCHNYIITCSAYLGHGRSLALTLFVIKFIPSFYRIYYCVWNYQQLPPLIGPLLKKWEDGFGGYVFHDVVLFVHTLPSGVIKIICACNTVVPKSNPSL